MPFFEHRGFRQYYEVRGEGPELVWAHGLYMSAAKDETFFGFLDDLSRHYKLLLFDARGHGRSSHTTDPADYTFDGLATDLLELLDHVGFSRCLFIGGSMGSITVLTLALLAPERVRAVVLFQPTCIGDDIPKVGRVARTLVKVIEREGLQSAAELVMGMGPWAKMAKVEPERVADLKASFAQQEVAAVKAASVGITLPPGYDRERLTQLKTLACPVLLIADPDDPAHPVTSAEQLHAVLPDSELVVAPTSFHFFRHRDELLFRLRQFLAVAPE